MKKLIKSLHLNRVPVNEGYDYIFSDEIYLPVYQSVLIVTKRTIIPLSLVEEIVLKLLSKDVYQIDELSKIMGLERRLLEITLADLYSKDLVAVSCNSCKLLGLGRKTLMDLSRSEKRQDILKDIYIDAVLGKFIDTESCQIIDKVFLHDNKLKAAIPLGDVNNYNDQFKKISEIFCGERKHIFSDGVQPIKEELLTIDKVDNTFVKFLKMPIHVYVSSNGVELDILSASAKCSELFDTYKDAILEQIKDKKILKSHFGNKAVQLSYKGNHYSENDKLYNELKKFYYKRNKNKKDFERIESILYSQRKLFHGEYKFILRHLAAKEKNVVLYVDNLDSWSYNLSFLELLQDLFGKKEITILYGNCKNEEKGKAQFERRLSIVKDVKREKHNYYICWEIGEYRLFGIPQQRNIINEETFCITVDYYIEKVF